MSNEETAPPPATAGGACEIEVAVLGPVVIRGARRPLRRPGALELVTYLALHREGVATEGWATALWPDRVMAAASLHSTASEARRALGASRSGHDHLPRQRGRLCLAPTVGTDWARFEAACATSQSSDALAALGLVRGRPFEGLRCPDWPVLEGWTAAIETAVVDAAERVAVAALAAGDAGRAARAARLALRVTSDERLYRILLRAADAAGNRLGLHAVMEELARQVGDAGWPGPTALGAHPSTLALYEELAGRGAPSQCDGDRSKPPRAQVRRVAIGGPVTR